MWRRPRRDRALPALQNHFGPQDVSAAISAGASDPSALAGCAARCGSQLNDVVGLVRGELSPLNR
jgi:hypothetical protein